METVVCPLLPLLLPPFLDSLYADVDSLVLYAGIHPKPDGRLHRALAKRFPFAIYYDFKDSVVTVVAVLDCRRDPASIVERLKHV